MEQQDIIDLEPMDARENPLQLSAGAVASAPAEAISRLEAKPSLTEPAPMSPKGWGIWGGTAKLLANSGIAPREFKGNVENCMIALDMAHRMRVSPMALMQKMFLIHGKPDMEVQFLLGLAYRDGRFRGVVQWDERDHGGVLTSGTGQEVPNISARAFGTLADGTQVSSTTVRMHRAIAEGWADRSRNKPDIPSKYETMPEDMLRYRSAGLLLKQYMPDLTLGLPTLSTYASPEPEIRPAAAVAELEE